MQFAINDKIFEQFPALTLGVVVAKNIDNSGEAPEVLALLKEQSDQIRKTCQLETLAEEPKLRAWRQAYDAFGAKSKKYQCSVENLYRMVLEGVDLRHISTVVDIYNYISLKYMVPVGGDDTDKVDGHITLRFATGDEPFIRLNSDEVDHPKPGEVIYADDKEILCRRWNWRECDKSKMTTETKNVALVVEGLTPITQIEVENAIDELSLLIKQYCGGQIQTHLLNSEKRSLEL